MCALFATFLTCRKSHFNHTNTNVHDNTLIYMKFSDIFLWHVYCYIFARYAKNNRG